ncbi:MAG: hypothetical protein ACREHG_10665 [Candidatus Saccharimonadales bacterium]
MIKEEKCYIVICDNCGEQLHDCDTDFSLFGEESYARATADYNRWVGDDDKDYCPGCAYRDEDDNVILKKREGRL